MDEDEVLDYEADYDVLTLVVSSDELEDECVSNKPQGESKAGEKPNMPNILQVESPKPNDKPDEIPSPENLRNFRIPKLKPELLKAQPSVMHTLYLQEAEEQQREKIKPSEDVRKSREEARAARRPKETIPQFAPPFRSTREESYLSQPENLAAPLFGPDDLAPIFVPPSSNREESNYHRHLHVPSSQYAPESLNPNGNFLAAVPNQRQPSGVSQYVPQNLATSERNTRPAEESRSQGGIGVKYWMLEIFGAKCLNYLDNNCLAASCDHTMSPVGEVERRLLSMPEETLVNTYRQALRSFHIFERYFKCFANIFERRKLGQHLLQMLANGRLYRNLTVSIVGHVYPALKRSGLEREATVCLMTDLWMPDKAHKFTELTLAILKILEAGNWKDYIDKLVELHETYKFLLSDEYMIRIMKWADVTKNEPLQKKAMMMLLADMATYARSPALMSLIGRFSNLEPNPNPPNVQQLRTGPVPGLLRGSPAQQYAAAAAANWNQAPNLNPQQDRLPGAVASPSLIRSGPQPQYQASNWNHNPHERLPGAGPGPGPSLIRSNPALTPLWNQNRGLPGAATGPSLIQSSPPAGQQEFPASNWRSIAENDNTFRFQ
ncbi:hypothetical protein KR032_010588 [Drosophila birchii]|nr:hypothetical protein KR032_010588 [Drosophila birchii]